jgi:geranylgeranyl pyrophosphate synthase
MESLRQRQCFMRHNDSLISGWRSAIEARLVAVEGWSGAAVRGITEHTTSQLHEACRYVAQGGGKRLRGILACAVGYDLRRQAADALAETSVAIAPAVALELLHAASLVHDDLPALDNDDLRRGRASCHKAFGEATAILTGDALLGAALMVVTSDARLSSDCQARVARTLGRAWWDLCLGQQHDIDQQGNKSSVSRDEMIRLKTGALFGASVGCGAVCAGVRESILEQYIEWGTRVGECFQALDDLDDGDRSVDERTTIESQCDCVLKELVDLDPRLAQGVTQFVAGQILGRVV